MSIGLFCARCLSTNIFLALHSGGYLVNFTSAKPLLKSHPAAYITSCSMLNCSIWEGGFMTNKYGLNFDSAMWTYVIVPVSEIPAVLRSPDSRVDTPA